MDRMTTISREDAERRAQQIFFAHAGIYVGVNALLAYIDLTNDPQQTWFYWPLAGWGAGLAAHAVGVFVTHRAADRVMHRVAQRAERREKRSERQENRAARKHAHN